jgi:diphosphomevalonate decarboxylase
MAHSGIVVWRSAANIALVKYWGKKGRQLPANASVSMTLSTCYTETSVMYKSGNANRGPKVRFSFDNKENPDFEPRIAHFTGLVARELPILNHLELFINTHNSFPYSAGIASSASSISSLALCLAAISCTLRDEERNNEAFYRKVSHLARLGSGSACRSVYGGWVLWGRIPEIVHSSDTYAVPVNTLVHPKFKNYHNAILIISTKPKQISSSLGHKLMEGNPYRKIRSSLADDHARELIHALGTGDEQKLADITEFEAANLHAMFLTSKSPFILIQPETLQVINKLTAFRKESKLAFFYTLDAGPNLHIIYPEPARDKMVAFIQSELITYCEEGKWIDDKTGEGPQIVETMYEKYVSF